MDRMIYTALTGMDAAMTRQRAVASNLANANTPGFRAETQIMALDLAGIAVSAGSACSSGKVTVSHVITALGAGEDEAMSTVRVSLGWNTPDDAPEIFLEQWRAAYDRATGKNTAVA